MSAPRVAPVAHIIHQFATYDRPPYGKARRLSLWLMIVSTMVAGVAIRPAQIAAQPLPGQQATGPVINSAGMSFKVENPTFVVPANITLKAVYEINAGGGDSVKVNEQLTTVARFYNLNVRNGIPEARIKTAAVFHGQGWTALLTDAAFAARFGGAANPSRMLVEELLQHGAQLVLCGQTAGSRGIQRSELLPGVQVAISAMTAINVLQADGYKFNPW